MDGNAIWLAADEQRAALRDLLEDLTEEQWRADSLCEGWTVRDVAAHVTFAQSGVVQMFPALLRAGFRTSVMIHDTAVASPLSREEIIATIRGSVGSRRHAVIVSEQEPLLDLLVHSQDIAVPLGIDHPMPVGEAIASLERVLQLNRNPMMRLRRPLTGVRLVATDADWSHGTGRTVAGPVKWLLLYAAGRGAAARHLVCAGDSTSEGELS